MTMGYAGRACVLAVAFGGLVLGLVVASTPPRVDAAQKDDKKDDYPRPDPALKKTQALLGASECKNCHSEIDPKQKDLYKETLGYEFIRLSENIIWSTHDLHSTAYRSLLTDRTVKNKKDKPNPTAQRMEDKLRKYKGENYTVATDVNCLACHATTKVPLERVPHTEWKATSFSITEGVGCEMCHGHGTLYEQTHRRSRDVEDKDKDVGPDAVKVVDWRSFPTTLKSEWGMTNLRDPATATHTCASCHIGNKDEGRFVTHDWYAAGHPPLPPLDLLAYTREQPRHWGFAHEMPYITNLADKDEKNKTDKAYGLYHFRKGESFVARRFAESALATLVETANLGAQLADDAKKKNDGLDFASFDCYSCHHNLKYPSERQDRGYVGRPGRPLYRPAAFALARLVLDHAGEMKGADLKATVGELDAAELELADAFTTKTYGDADKVKTATAKLAKWSEDTRKKLAGVRYTPEETKRLLEMVKAAASDEKKPVGDPEVAQLYTWAVETLYIELQPKDQTDKKVEPKALTDMRKSLDGTIVTRLRPNAAFYYEQGVTGGIPGPTVESVDNRLKARMEIFNSFQGAPFRKAFADLQPPK